MEATPKPLEEIVRELPPELQEEVRAFAECLLLRRRTGKRRFLRQDWGGALKEHREEYTSLELQKKTLEWRRG